MEELRNYFILITTVTSALLLYKIQSVPALFVLTTSLIIFFINYSQISRRLLNSEKMTRMIMQKQRDFFTEALTHDIRIPIIAQIRGIEILMKDSGSLNSFQNDLAKQIEQSCKCLLSMISLMLNTYNIENNTQRLYYEKFNMTELVRISLEELFQETREKNITFDYTAAKKIYVEADKSEIKKVVLNVLLNAIVHSGTNDRIRVFIEQNKRNIRFCVQIEKNNSFLPEYTFDSGYTTVGQNIRMYFCKKMIEFHKGKVFNSIKSPNKYVFEIPQKAVLS